MGIFSDGMTGDGSSEEPCVNQDLKEGKDPAMRRAEERALQVEGTWCAESLVSPGHCGSEGNQESSRTAVSDGWILFSRSRKPLRGFRRE